MDGGTASPRKSQQLRRGMMYSIKITDIPSLERHPHLVNDLWTMYEEAFPYDERRDPQSILSLLETPDHDICIHLYPSPEDAQCLVAFAVLHRLECADYIEYLCVSPSRRNEQWGSRILDHIASVTPLPLVLEAEPPGATPWASRRIDFYLRNAFTLLDLQYYQPAYHSDSSPVELRLLVRGTISDTSRLPRLLYRDVYHLEPSHPLYTLL